MWQPFPNQMHRMVPYNVQEMITTTMLPNPNGSIDYVVNQIESLAGKINTLTATGEEAGLEIRDKAVDTFHKMTGSFSNETIPNVEKLLDIVNQKAHNWPVTALIVLIIVGIVLVIITLIFLFMRFSQSLMEYRYRKKVSTDNHDIENI